MITSILILSLSSIQAMLFYFDDEELQEENPENSFDLSEMKEVLEEISTENLSTIPNSIKKPKKERAHARSSSDAGIYKEKEKIPDTFVNMQMIFAYLGIDLELLKKDSNTIYEIIQKRYEEILTQVCSPSEISVQEQNLILLNNLINKIFKKD